MPVEVGSVTFRAAAAAIAASAAEPPWLRISSPACAAKGCDVATIPRRPITGERLDWKESVSIDKYIPPTESMARERTDAKCFGGLRRYDAALACALGRRCSGCSFNAHGVSVRRGGSRTAPTECGENDLNHYVGLIYFLTLNAGVMTRLYTLIRVNEMNTEGGW